jgi:hypothetical protein
VKSQMFIKLSNCMHEVYAVYVCQDTLHSVPVDVVACYCARDLEDRAECRTLQGGLVNMALSPVWLS